MFAIVKLIQTSLEIHLVTLVVERELNLFLCSTTSQLIKNKDQPIFKKVHKCDFFIISKNYVIVFFV